MNYSKSLKLKDVSVEIDKIARNPDSYRDAGRKVSR